MPLLYRNFLRAYLEFNFELSANLNVFVCILSRNFMEQFREAVDFVLPSCSLFISQTMSTKHGILGRTDMSSIELWSCIMQKQTNLSLSLATYMYKNRYRNNMRTFPPRHLIPSPDLLEFLNRISSCTFVYPDAIANA